MSCEITAAHEPHSYTVLMTTRRCPGITKEPHFCGDRKPHRRHENRTHYCPGVTKRQLDTELDLLRSRLRRHGLAPQRATLNRDLQAWYNALQALDIKQAKIEELQHRLLTPENA